MNKVFALLLASGMLAFLPQCAKAELPGDREKDTSNVTQEIQASPAAGNLITDPSFENGQTSYRIIRMASALQPIKQEVKDERYVSRIDDSLARTGNRSLSFSTSNPEGRNYLSFVNLPCEPHQEYEFGIWYRTQDVAPGSTLWCEHWCYDKNGKHLKQVNGSHYDVTPGKWHHFRLRFFPVENSRFCTVTLKFCGPMQVRVDDASFHRLPEAVFPKSDGRILVQTPDFTCYAERPCFQIPESGLPENLRPGKEVELSAAGNEAESFQLVLNTKQDLKAVSAAVSDLVCGKNILPVSQTEIRRVEFAGVIRQANPRMGGRHADPLVSFHEPVQVQAEKNLGLYLTVRVPAQTPRGVYRGKVTLRNEGKVLAEIPLAVKVRGFSLPDRPALKTYFYTIPGFSPRNYAKLDPRPSSVALDEAQKLLRLMRVSGNQAFKAAAPKWKIRDGHVVVTDWKPFDDSLEKMIREYHFSNFGIPVLRLIGDNAGWFKSPGRKTHTRWKRTVGSEPPATPFGGYYDEPVGLGYVIDYAKAFLAHTKEKFPEIDFYYYIYDEVPFDVYKELTPILKNLTEAVPDLKIMMVSGNYGDLLPPYHTRVSALDGASIHPAVRNYSEQWYYQYQSSLDPARYLAARGYPWRIYLAGGSGALLWSTMYYGPPGKPFDPWTELGTKYAEPFATIFYPPHQGKGGVVPSLRAWQIRDGIEDFDYLKLLEAKKGRDYVLKIIVPFIADPLEIRSDYRTLLKIREKIAEELEQ